MSVQTSEQILHDRVNLARLVRRLEKTVATENWNTDVDATSNATWIKARGTLQKVKFARKLLRRAELYDTLPSSPHVRYGVIKDSLDRLEARVGGISIRVTYKPLRPEPILPKIPVPVERPSVPPPSAARSKKDIELPLIPTDADASVSISAEDLLLSPSDTAPLSLDDDSLLFPPSPARPPISPAVSSSTQGASAGAAAPAFLQNSTALQEELSAQLAHMATQLKNNTLHFASSLEKDKSVLTEAQEKLERNYDVMTKERVRLRDHHSKSWGTTWITILSIIVAIVGFMLTFFVIRLTR
ncbi:unnamed protein product [Somion occarium]|uniref:Uncharacterized protein n=1 Tax=Somion occarium TaxID=3059160 RepID=A0ABP1DDS9_9APHY